VRSTQIDRSFQTDARVELARPDVGTASGASGVVALLGQPVADSLSPRMQNAAFAARGLDWIYVALDVPPERLATAVRGLAAAGLAGANVTAPHKLAAAELAEGDEPSVNTLVFDEGRIQGFSTDAAVLEGLSAERPVILGDGGAAVAFRAALRQARVFARRGEWPPDASGADLVVNATSARDEVLLELGPGQTLVDLPYPETATAQAALAAGATVVTGLEVLVAQGAAAFELWTGLPAPLEVMRTAVGLRA
jgi:shikimate dehydrogenase